MTPTEIRDMTPEARTDLFERLATSHYGPHYITALAADFDYDRSTIRVWKQRNTVPFAVLLQLSAWHDGGSGKIREIRAELKATAQLLAQVARQFEKITRRLSDDGDPSTD